MFFTFPCSCAGNIRQKAGACIYIQSLILGVHKDVHWSVGVGWLQVIWVSFFWRSSWFSFLGEMPPFRVVCVCVHTGLRVGIVRICFKVIVSWIICLFCRLPITCSARLLVSISVFQSDWLSYVCVCVSVGMIRC